METWSSVGAAVVGAVAALAGVMLTQREARREAAEERVWTDRVSAYASATDWASERSQQLTQALVVWDEQRQVSELSADLVTQHPPHTALHLFASDEVLDRFTAARSACHEAYTAYVEARRVGPHPATYGSELRAALDSLDALQAQMRSETRR